MCGYAADMPALRELCAARSLHLVEDAAQALGARVCSDGHLAGTSGAIGCLSVFSKKQLCLGEGGMVLTADEALARRVRLLRSHAMTSGTWDRHRGHEDAYDVVDIGFNFRLDEPRAAFGLSRMQRTPAAIEHRRAVVRSYRERLAGVPGITLVWDEAAVEAGSHFAFPVLFDGADASTAARTASRVSRSANRTANAKCDERSTSASVNVSSSPSTPASRSRYARTSARRTSMPSSRRPSRLRPSAARGSSRRKLKPMSTTS